jgi:hypothetical protein
MTAAPLPRRGSLATRLDELLDRELIADLRDCFASDFDAEDPPGNEPGLVGCSLSGGVSDDGERWSAAADEAVGGDEVGVAATNAVSDIYAMGGRPLFALNLVGWNSEALPLSLLGEVLAGGQDVATAAGFAIAGGHTIDDPEPKYGMSVTGEVHPDRILTKIVPLFKQGVRTALTLIAVNRPSVR